MPLLLPLNDVPEGVLTVEVSLKGHAPARVTVPPGGTSASVALRAAR